VTIAERVVNDVTIVALQGRLILGEGAEELRPVVDRLLSTGQPRIVIDLSGVPFVDSAGLGELVRTVNSARKAGGAARLLNPTSRIVDLLRIAKVHSLVQVYQNEDDAVRSFSS
jgi:anti-sigma B factor antagonist